MSEKDPMAAFGYMLGEWDLDYRVPESHMSPKTTGTGHGVFRSILDGACVTFDYTCVVGGQSGSAHGIFARDKSNGLYRYWWFESSGAFMTATCSFLRNDLLFMQWENSLLRQTFELTNPKQILLSMDHPDTNGEYQPVLEVVLTRRD